MSFACISMAHLAEINPYVERQGNGRMSVWPFGKGNVQISITHQEWAILAKAVDQHIREQ